MASILIFKALSGEAELLRPREFEAEHIHSGRERTNLPVDWSCHQPRRYVKVFSL